MNVQEKYRTTPFWAYELGHNDIEVSMAGEFLRRLQDFLHYVEMKELFNYKKRVLRKKRSEIDLLKKIISRKMNDSNNSSNRKDKTASTEGMKLFVDSEEDRHENEQKEERPKSSSRMNDACDFDILNLCSPKSLKRQVSITVEDGKIEVFSDAEEEALRKNKESTLYYNHNDESPYELKSTSKEFNKFVLPLDARRSPECLV